MKSFIDALHKAHVAGLVPVEWRIPKFALELAKLCGEMKPSGYQVELGTLMGVPITEVENDKRAELICAPPVTTDIKL